MKTNLKLEVQGFQFLCFYVWTNAMMGKGTVIKVMARKQTF